MGTTLPQARDRSGHAVKDFLTSEVTIKQTTVQNVQVVQALRSVQNVRTEGLFQMFSPFQPFPTVPTFQSFQLASPHIHRPGSNRSRRFIRSKCSTALLRSRRSRAGAGSRFNGSTLTPVQSLMFKVQCLNPPARIHCPRFQPFHSVRFVRQYHRRLDRRSPFSVTRRSFLSQKADLPLVGLRWGHHLAYRVEDHFELSVVFQFQHFELVCQIFVSSQYFP